MNDELEQPDDLPEFDEVDLGQVIVQALQQSAQMQQQMMQMMAMLAQQIEAAAMVRRRVVRDEAGRVVGSEPVIEG